VPLLDWNDERVRGSIQSAILNWGVRAMQNRLNGSPYLFNRKELA